MRVEHARESFVIFHQSPSTNPIHIHGIVVPLHQSHRGQSYPDKHFSVKKQIHRFQKRAAGSHFRNLLAVVIEPYLSLSFHHNGLLGVNIVGSILNKQKRNRDCHYRGNETAIGVDIKILRQDKKSRLCSRDEEPRPYSQLTSIVTHIAELLAFSLKPSAFSSIY